MRHIGCWLMSKDTEKDSEAKVEEEEQDLEKQIDELIASEEEDNKSKKEEITW